MPHALKISRIGNSQGLILSKEILELMNLKIGDTIYLENEGKELKLILKKK